MTLIDAAIFYAFPTTAIVRKRRDQRNLFCLCPCLWWWWLGWGVVRIHIRKKSL